MTEQRSDAMGREHEALLNRCLAGDDAAWRDLMAYVRREALDAARWRYHLSREDSEDLAQVVQIRVAQRITQIRDRGAFSYWLRRLIHCASIDLMRQRRSCLSLDELLQPSNTGFVEPAAADEYGQVDLRADLDEALSHLPDRYQEPIRLHLLDGFPQDEVGRILGRPRSTVASQIERGLRRLQRNLASVPTGWA